MAEKSAENAPTEDAESRPEEKQAVIQIDQEGVMFVRLDLAKSSYPFCLGFAVMITDAIRQYFMAQEMKKQRIVRPDGGVIHGLKQAANKFGKIFKA